MSVNHPTQRKACMILDSFLIDWIDTQSLTVSYSQEEFRKRKYKKIALSDREGVTQQQR